MHLTHIYQYSYQLTYFSSSISIPFISSSFVFMLSDVWNVKNPHHGCFPEYIMVVGTLIISIFIVPPNACACFPSLHTTHSNLNLLIPSSPCPQPYLAMSSILHPHFLIFSSPCLHSFFPMSSFLPIHVLVPSSPYPHPFLFISSFLPPHVLIPFSSCPNSFLLMS